MSGNKPFKPYNGNEKYIFVSYNHDDADTVYEIISDFHSRGYRLWYDTGICVGDNFVAALAERIKNCEIFLCFLSPQYIESPYCKRELNFALSNHKKIIPIKTENFKLPDSIAFALSAINWTNLTRFPSEKELVDFICETNQSTLLPCKEEKEPHEITPPPPPPPPPPPRPKWPAILLGAAAAMLVIAGAILAFRSKDAGSSDPGTAPLPEPAVTQESAAVPEEKEAEAMPEETVLPAETADKAPLAAISPELLASSGQKAISYLSGRAKGGCPLSVYDPKGSAETEADDVYDNAVAAMALLGNIVRNKNHSDSDLKLVLDSLSERADSGTILSASTGTKSLAAAAVSLLQYDRVKTSFAYVRSAQTILDWVLENAGNEAGGFNRSCESEDRATADNLWLYSAFQLLYAKTGNSVYSEAAKSAESFARSMRSSDGSFYLAGSFRNEAQSPDILSAETQALAAAVMNDRTGISKTVELCGSGGRFSPDDQSAGSFGIESTLLMALAFRSLEMEEEAGQALAAVQEYQMEDGSIPETDVASFCDGEGRVYTNQPRTADAGWYAVLAEEYNPFLIAG